ncbi:hypothetical protein PIB30_039750 [Stylosanthes scabra]|uniref:Transmembrane protein n=1 Tax=Stylosanthes scabra TaxID=79078 RepID=A0ABU6TF58_9FABA|nr:hypothetical protein [Stylosanthes scabra]
MQSERDIQSWRIDATAKANGFNFKFKFRFNNLTNPNFTPTTWTLSCLLKIRKFTFRISSQKPQPKPHAIITPRRNEGRFVRNKIMKIVHKFQARFKKKKKKTENNRLTIVATNTEESRLPYPKDPIHVGFGVVGFLVFLAESMISRRGLRGMVMVASLLFNKLRLVIKFMNSAFFSLMVVAIVVCMSLNKIGIYGFMFTRASLLLGL